MTFTIPNVADAAYQPQAQVDSGDIAMLTAGIATNGVLAGGAVTPGSGMQVSVASGSAQIGGSAVSFSNASPSVAASGVSPRFDLVSVNASGTVSVTTGTGASNPVYPAIPANSVVLAALYIPVGTGSVTSSLIVDKRVTVPSIATLGTPFINVKTYGAVGDGTTDDTTAITNAIAALSGGGGMIFFPAGTYVTAQQTLKSGQWFVGAGYEASRLLLKASTNADLLISNNFASLTGTNSTSGVYNCGIIGMTLDGNKANNTAGRCLSIYGYGYMIRDVRMRNAAADGMYSEWSNSSPSPGNDSMEAYILNFKIHDCKGNGLLFYGPHDTQIDHGIIYSCGTNGNHNVHLGLLSTTGLGAGARISHTHCWGGPVDYQAQIHDSSVAFDNCIFEGAAVAQVYADAGIQLKSCTLFSAGVNSNLTRGIIMGSGAMTPASHSTIVDCDIFDCYAGPLDMTYAQGYSLIDVHVLYGALPVNTTSSTTVTPGSQAITVASGTNITVGMVLQIDANTGNSEVVTVTAATGTSVTATFANAHSGTYPVANAAIVGTPQLTNTIRLHSGKDGGGVYDDAGERLAGSLAIHPASATQVPLTIQLVNGQSGYSLQITDYTGAYLSGFGSNGNLGVGIGPNAAIELLAQARTNTDSPLVLVGHSTSQSGALAKFQTSAFANLSFIDQYGRWNGTSANAPAAAAGANNGSSAPSPVVGGGSNDQRGFISFGSGSGPSAGAQAVITFANTWGSSPIVILTPTLSNTQALGIYVSSVSTSGFTISTVNAPAASQGNSTYGVVYQVMG